MSDGESNTEFTEFKDNVKPHTIVNVPHPVQKVVDGPKKDAHGFAVAENPHPTWSFNWAMFYLGQTRVMVMIVLTLFFLSLCLAIYLIGAPTHSKTVVLCPEWKDVVPAASSRCPSQTVQLYYPNQQIVKGDTIGTPSNVAGPPMAVFLPHASSQYYYTIVIVDPDSSSPQHLIGLATNVRLAETLSLDDSWVTPYTDPQPTNNGLHRIVFLVYRHMQAFNGNQPLTRNYFNIDAWFKDQWKNVPELIGANYFRMKAL